MKTRRSISVLNVAEKTAFKDLTANLLVFTFWTHILPEYRELITISFNQSRTGMSFEVCYYVTVEISRAFTWTYETTARNTVGKFVKNISFNYYFISS